MPTRFVLPLLSTTRSGARIDIRGAIFKVLSCFPPSGVTAPDTVFRADGAHLSMIPRIVKILVLPTAASALLVRVLLHQRLLADV